jgi:hypothetical protein
MSARFGIAAAVLVLFVSVAPSAQGDLGIVPGSFKTVAVNRDGTFDTQAGSHPYEYTVSFAFNTDAQGKPEGNVRDVEVALPPGLVGYPLTVPRCTRQQFEGLVPVCPGDTQIGTVQVVIAGLATANVPLFNMVPPPGVAARFGFNSVELDVFQDASVRPLDGGGGYGVAESVHHVPIRGVVSAVETIWGVPPDPSHDAERECPGQGLGCSSQVTPKPFLTLPTSCAGPLATTLSADSVEDPGVFTSENSLSLDAGGNPAGLAGCDRVPFEPSLTAQPETRAVSSPTGLRVDLRITQSESVEGLATANLKDAVLTFPEGMTINPSAAAGLQACSSVQIGLGSSEPAVCPPASKIGTVEAVSPVIDHPLVGSVFLAAQGDNPFGSLLAFYIVIEDPVTGVVVKVPVHVEANPVTGRLTVRLDEAPQVPYSDLKVDMFGGPRAPLTTPAACGTATTSTDLVPWSSPQALDATPTSSFVIDQGCGAQGFSPAFTAGSASGQAGAFTPFSVTLSRRDGEQAFRGVSVTTPPGLLAILKGVPLCGEAQANAGSCDAASQVGEASATVGVGEPFLVTGGRVYLTGPYGGAPFGLSVVVPAVAGPFDLGVEVVRAGIHIDPHTAQPTIVTDTSGAYAVPSILDGVPLYIRTVNVTVNRPGFTFNPTDCQPLATTASVTSTTGTTVGVSSPFEASNCAGLPFHPVFTVSTQAKSSKQNGASLTVKTVYPKGPQANIRSVGVILPKQLPARLTTIQQACPEATFAQNPASCPAGSDIGTAIASTPILAAPFTGPAYLVSHGGAAFPDLVIVFQSEGITFDLVGSINIRKGITSSTFAAIPDAPISSFQVTFPEGPHSGLAAVVPAKAKGSLCGQALRMPITITGQNGAVIKQNTKIAVTGCLKAKAKKKHRKSKKHVKTRKG